LHLQKNFKPNILNSSARQVFRSNCRIHRNINVMRGSQNSG
jgi:hypothetical protein